MPETRVVNVKHGEPYDIYIGRATPRQRRKASIWANPFHIGQDGTRGDVIEQYRIHLRQHPELIAQVGSLRGKTLACWCAPEGGVTAADPMVCHGQVLALLADLAGQEAPDA